MRNFRLVWQLFPTYMLITIVAILAIGWYALQTLEQFYLSTIRQDLEVRAQLLKPEIGPWIEEDSTDQLIRYVVDFSEKTSTRVTIIRPDGVVIADSHTDPLKMERHNDRPEIIEALRGDVGSTTRFSETAGQRMMYVALPVTKNEKTIAVVRTSISVTRIDDKLREIKIDLAKSGIVIAGLAAILSLFVSRRIAKPLEGMRLGAERFAKGDLDYRLPLPASRELAGLASSLNLMADQMRQRLRTISMQSTEQDAVLASMVEGVFAVDVNRKIISINEAAAHILQCDRHQAIGRSIDLIIVSAELRKIVDRSLDSKKVRHPKPIQEDVELNSGLARVIQVRGTPLGSAEVASHGAVIVLNDVTHFRRLESLRKDFVANVSHELKTPITSIKGFVETLQDGAVENEEDARRFLGIIAKQTDRLGAIVEDLLSLAKIEQSEQAEDLPIQLANVYDLLQSSIGVCQELADESKVAIRLSCKPGLAIRCNRRLLEQAVNNLLDNAIKYSTAESHIEVIAEKRENQIAISVRDFGPGIESQHLPRLFERFYRVDQARSRNLGGTGLGLAIVKHIAAAHRGSVHVESVPGTGSTFSILLPIDKAG